MTRLEIKAAVEPTIGRNRLLAGMPVILRERLNLEVVSLQKGAALFDVGEVAPYAYFPVSGLVSLVALTSDGAAVDLAIVAGEGVIGLSSLLHVQPAPCQAVVRLSGCALRCHAPRLRREIEYHADLRGLILEYANHASAEIAQAVVCQCFHTVTQRCCRWLLLAADRTESSMLEITQDNLAEALGVARRVAGRTAQGLMDAGAIRYRYGRLTIVNRSSLERTACECYSRPR